jgi:hypothetical protein
LSETEFHDEFSELCAVSTLCEFTEEEQKRFHACILLYFPPGRSVLSRYEAVVGPAIYPNRDE